MRLSIICFFYFLFFSAICSLDKQNITQKNKEHIIKAILTKIKSKMSFLKEKIKEKKIKLS